MAKKERTLETIQLEIDDKTSKAEAKAAELTKLGQEREALIDEHDEVKVAGFDPNLVALAHSKGVNAKNFATEDQLRSALETSPKDEA